MSPTSDQFALPDEALDQDSTPKSGSSGGSDNMTQESPQVALKEKAVRYLGEEADNRKNALAQQLKNLAEGIRTALREIEKGDQTLPPWVNAPLNNAAEMAESWSDRLEASSTGEIFKEGSAVVKSHPMLSLLALGATAWIAISMFGSQGSEPKPA